MDTHSNNVTDRERVVAKLEEQVSEISISEMSKRLTTSNRLPEIPKFLSEPQQTIKTSKAQSGKVRVEKPKMETDLFLQRRPQGGWRWVRKQNPTKQ